MYCLYYIGGRREKIKKYTFGRLYIFIPLWRRERFYRFQSNPFERVLPRRGALHCDFLSPSLYWQVSCLLWRLFFLYFIAIQNRHIVNIYVCIIKYTISVLPKDYKLSYYYTSAVSGISFHIAYILYILTWTSVE